MSNNSSAAPGPEFAVVTDSSACLPDAVIKHYEIIVVPLVLLLGGKVYRDGELSGHALFDLLKQSRRASTAAPAPGEFVETFRRARERGAPAVLCLTLSSKFSGTHSAALTAVSIAGSEMPGFPVRVVDTGALAMAHGLAVLSAARAAASGACLEDAVAALTDRGRESHLIGILETTEYLARGGRVPWIVHWAASLLRIKPVLAAEGERIGAVARARTYNGAISKMIDHMARHASPDHPPDIGVMHAAAPEKAEALAQTLRERFAPRELLIGELTGVMAVHTGPGFVGTAWRSAEPQEQAEAARAPKRRSLEADVRALNRLLGPLPAARHPPSLIVLSGLPASGKSHLADELARRYPLVVVNSDAMRRALFVRPRYTQVESARLFAAIHRLIERLLAGGLSVVFDATNLKEAHRQPLYAVAERTGARELVVAVQAPELIVQQRLAGRASGVNPLDRSEANTAVYESMLGEAEPIERRHIVVDTSEDVSAAAERILRQLDEVPA